MLSLKIETGLVHNIGTVTPGTDMNLIDNNTNGNSLAYNTANT